MWRKLLRFAHPDAGGDGDLFVWVRSLQEHVTGDAIEDPPREHRRRPPPHHRQTQAGDRAPHEARHLQQALFPYAEAL